MIGKLRTFGLLTFWSAVVMVAMSPVMLLLSWLASGGGYFMWWWAFGLLVLLGATGFVFFQRWERSVALVLEEAVVSGRLRAPRRLRVPSHYEVVLLAQPLVGIMATLQAIDNGQRGGMLWAVIAYALAWPFMQFLPWIAWFRSRHEDPLPPKQSVNRSSVVHVSYLSTGDEDAEHVEVAVRLDEESSFAEVLREVVRVPVLPGIAGGERTWLVLVDGSAVGVLTQTWEHPRWWPAIAWSVDASDRFDGERIRFEPDGR